MVLVRLDIQRSYIHLVFRVTFNLCVWLNMPYSFFWRTVYYRCQRRQFYVQSSVNENNSADVDDVCVCVRVLVFVFACVCVFYYHEDYL